jgi:hypothetical protein
MALILEDDAIIGPDVFEVTIPPCDLYCLGYNRAEGKRTDLDYFEPAGILGFYGLHCYIVTRAGAEKLVKLKTDFHIDIIMYRCKDLKILCHHDSICVQEFLSSNISKKNKNLLEFLLYQRDQYNVDGPRYMMGLTFFGVNLWCIVFLIAGILNLPLVYFTVVKKHWSWYTVGRVLSRKLFSSKTA